jgi:hypothetical protein
MALPALASAASATARIMTSRDLMLCHPLGK